MTVPHNSFKIYELIAEAEVSENRMKDLESKMKWPGRHQLIPLQKACMRRAFLSIHHDRNIALQELKHESIYADLLVIDARKR